LNVTSREIVFCVTAEQLGIIETEISTIEVFGNWDEWKSPFSLKKEDDFWWSASATLQLGEWNYKYRINGTDWKFNPCLESVNTDSACNNVIAVNNGHKLHTNLVNIKTTLNEYHDKLQSEYNLIYNQIHSDQVISIQREDESCTTCYTLIAKAPTATNDQKSLTLTLNGRLLKIHHVYNFRGHYECQETGPNQFETICANIEETEDIASFGSVFFSANNANDYIHFSNLPASFVCILETEHDHDNLVTLNALQDLTNDSEKRLSEFFREEKLDV
jgi:hypothetical protein